jgi:hypothetical protein
MKVFKAILVMALFAGCAKPPENVIITNEYTLTVNRTGTGSGTITSSIPGIDCGDTCASIFAKNANVLLIATPSQGSRFSGWSGACSGNDCTVTMTADKTVYATFQIDGGNSVTDTEKPTVTISSPATGQTVSSASLTVTGTASDNKAVTNLEYSLNNAARVTLNAGTSFSFPVMLTAGTNTINVYAKDAAGNEGISSVNMTYTVLDTIKPVVTISSPTAGQTVPSPSLTVTGTASDNTAVTGLEYSLNNAARIALTTGTSFSFPVTLVAGSNTINVYAKDAVGNESVSGITVTYSQPSFTITPEKTVFFVGQKSVAFWKVNIAGRQNFNTSGAAFDSVTLENNAILGTGVSKIQFNYRKTDSTQDEIVLEIGAGSSVPVGDYAMTVRATSGSTVKESAVTVRVAPCSLGCQ